MTYTWYGAKSGESGIVLLHILVTFYHLLLYNI